jgi:hypothetical protein
MDVDYQVITSKKKYFLLLPDNSDCEFQFSKKLAEVRRITKKNTIFGNCKKQGSPVC